jgi:hypothetical protein
MDTSEKWHSYSVKKAVFVGIAAAIGILLMFYLTDALHFGGGSVSKGWQQASGMMGLFAIILAPFSLVAGVVFALLCKPFGIRLVFGIGFAIFLSLVAHSAYSSRPEIVLKNIGDLDTAPQIRFTKFDVYPTFSDGTTFSWSANCDEISAASLFESLKLKTLLDDDKSKFSYGFDEHDLVSIHQGIFGKEMQKQVYLTSSKGFIGVYSPSNRRMNLIWSPILSLD